jgi:hypothetical protein
MKIERELRSSALNQTMRPNKLRTPRARISHELSGADGSIRFRQRTVRVSSVLSLLVLVLQPGLCSAQSKPSFDRVEVGSFDPDAWNGIEFLAQAFHQPAGFALRVGSQSAKSGGTFVDGPAIDNAVGEVGPHAPDGSYCRVSWRNVPRETLITLEWSRVDQTTVVGRLTAKSGFQLVLETYFPTQAIGGGGGATGFYRVDATNRAILGEQFFNQVFGTPARFLLMADRPLLGSGIYPSLTQLDENMRSTESLVSSLADEPTAGAAGLEFAGGDSEAVHFVAQIGWNTETLLSQARSLLTAGKIDSILKQKSEAYASHRPAITGLFEGAPTAIGNSIFWNTLYAPSSDLTFPSDSRIDARQWGGWIVGEWDFFSSFLTSVEDVDQTEAYVRAILGSQTSTGMVPNMTSASATTVDRSNPPVGAFSVLKIYQRWHDRQLLEWAYPRLKKYHEWWFADRGDGQPWRDGNRNGLLEWGSDRGSSPTVGGRGFLQGAKWESGMDDSPMWDDATYDAHTYTMTQDDVGLNSLYAVDAECLSSIASLLGKDEDARQFSAEYTRIKQLVQEKLWNPEDGIYESRFWDGHFSKRLSPTNFYPLFAGIATPEQADQMVKKHLLNPEEFWGKYVIPTIARNDPSFDDQFYWRGDIWGATNYLVYEGLNRYGFDKVALEVAEKSYGLFMDDWTDNQHYDEQYRASGGNGGGETHYMWSGVLCLMALEQYIDVSHWDGLRFGAFDPASSGQFRNVRWQDHVYDISIGPTLTSVVRDGKAFFQADAGVVVRNYAVQSSEVSFTIHSPKDTDVATEEFASGLVLLSIDGKSARRIVVQEGKASFTLPAGEHKVALRK